MLTRDNQGSAENLAEAEPHLGHGKNSQKAIIVKHRRRATTPPAESKTTGVTEQLSVRSFDCISVPARICDAFTTHNFHFSGPFRSHRPSFLFPVSAGYRLLLEIVCKFAVRTGPFPMLSMSAIRDSRNKSYLQLSIVGLGSLKWWLLRRFRLRYS